MGVVGYLRHHQPSTRSKNAILDSASPAPPLSLSFLKLKILSVCDIYIKFASTHHPTPPLKEIPENKKIKPSPIDLEFADAFKSIGGIE